MSICSHQALFLLWLIGWRLTAGDNLMQVLAHTVNGTTYAGIRGRTTGAPQNHWFGPSGDPRGAGIGTPEVPPPPCMSSCARFPSSFSHSLLPLGWSNVWLLLGVRSLL